MSRIAQFKRKPFRVGTGQVWYGEKLSIIERASLCYEERRWPAIVLAVLGMIACSAILAAWIVL